MLDGLGEALRLEEHDLEPSRAVMHDYGNVSSSTTWWVGPFQTHVFEYSDCWWSGEWAVWPISNPARARLNPD